MIAVGRRSRWPAELSVAAAVGGPRRDSRSRSPILRRRPGRRRSPVPQEESDWDQEDTASVASARRAGVRSPRIDTWSRSRSPLIFNGRDDVSSDDDPADAEPQRSEWSHDEVEEEAEEPRTISISSEETEEEEQPEHERDLDPDEDPDGYSPPTEGESRRINAEFYGTGAVEPYDTEAGGLRYEETSRAGSTEEQSASSGDHRLGEQIRACLADHRLGELPFR